MNKNTILRIFGEAFLRAMVIIMGIAILGFGGFFLVKAISGGGSNGDSKSTEELTDEQLKQMLEEQAATDEGIPTEDTEATTEAATEATTEAPVTSSKDKKILVLNSTETKGLAKAWADKLKADGYTTVDTGNYSAERLTDSKIIVNDNSVGQDLVAYFNAATRDPGTAPTGVDVSTDGYDIYIIIGTADNIK